MEMAGRRLESSWSPFELLRLRRRKRKTKPWELTLDKGWAFGAACRPWSPVVNNRDRMEL